LFSGRKTFLIFSPVYAQLLESEEMGWFINTENDPRDGYGSFARDIDIDQMDLLRFPKWATLEYTTAEVAAGDCLFLPSFWYHQVNSGDHGERNLAVNFWFFPAPRFQQTECSEGLHFAIANCTWLTPTWTSHGEDFVDDGSDSDGTIVYSECADHSLYGQNARSRNGASAEAADDAEERAASSDYDDEGISPEGDGLPLGLHKKPLAYVDSVTAVPALAELAQTYRRRPPTFAIRAFLVLARSPSCGRMGGCACVLLLENIADRGPAATPPPSAAGTCQSRCAGRRRECR
jgi:hypothetical protein